MRICTISFVTILAISTIVLILTTRFYIMGNQSKKLADVGLDAGKLKTCPDRPSCVCSLDDRERHTIEAFPISDKLSDPIQTLVDIIAKMKRTEISKQKKNYLHATFTSAVFQFVDDVEFYLVDDTIHVRSVSRVGYSDLGVNRKRVEKIRKLYLKNF